MVQCVLDDAVTGTDDADRMLAVRRTHLDVYHMLTVALKNTTSQVMSASQTCTLGTKEPGWIHLYTITSLDGMQSAHSVSYRCVKQI